MDISKKGVKIVMTDNRIVTGYIKEDNVDYFYVITTLKEHIHVYKNNISLIYMEGY